MNVAPSRSQVDVSKLHVADAKALRLEREAARLSAQVEALQGALQASQMQVSELQDVRDITGAAVAALEETLGRIERAATGAAGKVPAAGPSGVRRAPAAGCVRMHGRWPVRGCTAVCQRITTGDWQPL
jgi:hypothetical protein